VGGVVWSARKGCVLNSPAYFVKRINSLNCDACQVVCNQVVVILIVDESPSGANFQLKLILLISNFFLRFNTQTLRNLHHENP
jgi:hypothetical protein